MSSTKKAKIDKNLQVIPVQQKKDWWPPVLFVLAGILIFYPPLMGGLFHDSRMFASHIFTSLVFVLMLADRIYHRQYVLLKTPMDWAILAYAGAYLLSLIGAVHPGEAFYGFLKALNYFMVYWIVSNVASSYRQVRELLKVMLAAGLSVAAIGILAAFGYSDYPGAFRFEFITGTLQYSNTMAAYLAVMILLGITLIQQEKNTYLKILYSIANFLMAFAFFGAVSKGAWVILLGGALLLVIGLPGIYRLKSIYYIGLGMGSGLLVYQPFHAALAGAPGFNVAPYFGLGVLLATGGVLLWEMMERLWNKHRHAPLIIILAFVMLLGAGAFIGGQALLSSNLKTELSDLGNRGSDSYVTRMDFMHIAVDITKEHPLNGTGAGGWKALFQQHQKYYYWTTQTHSHIFQVLVEAGIIGLLAFACMWAMLLYYIYCLYKNRKKDNWDQWILGWGIAVGSLALGAHAAFDFDLSIPAMCMVLWTMLSMLNSLYIQAAAPHETSGKSSFDRIQCGIAVLLAVVLLVSGSRYLYAANQAVIGKKAFISGMNQTSAAAQKEDLNRAVQCYEKAVKSDPMNGIYRGDLASVQGTLYLTLAKKQDPEAFRYRQDSLEMMESAVKVYPYSAELLSALVRNSAITGNLPGLLQYGQMEVKTSPNLISVYEDVAAIWWDACQQCEENDQHEMAVKFARQIAQLEKDLHRQIRNVEPDHPYWEGRRLKISPELKLVFEQARDFLAAEK